MRKPITIAPQSLKYYIQSASSSFHTLSATWLHVPNFISSIILLTLFCHFTSRSTNKTQSATIYLVYMSFTQNDVQPLHMIAYFQSQVPSAWSAISCTEKGEDVHIKDMGQPATTNDIEPSGWMTFDTVILPMVVPTLGTLVFAFAHYFESNRMGERDAS